jgi:hypothetical protein
MVRYGVFLVGELWTVSNDERPLICFKTRAEAVRAARRLAEESAGRGQNVQLDVMDIGGELRRLDFLPAVSENGAKVKAPPVVRPQSSGTAEIRA